MTVLRTRGQTGAILWEYLEMPRIERRSNDMLHKFPRFRIQVRNVSLSIQNSPRGVLQPLVAIGGVGTDAYTQNWCSTRFRSYVPDATNLYTVRRIQ